MKKSIVQMFEKKFNFNKSDDWVLPPVEQTFQEPYEFSNLQEMKDSLNSVKSKLNAFPFDEWKKHTARRSPSGSVSWKLKSSIDAELVTKAWCKFYECIHEFPIIPGCEFNSFHLCELPGAFVAALNHYLHSTYKQSDIKWKWLASSLNPYHEGNMLGEMLTDDRFLFHTLNNWIFGEDFTGNIIDERNIEHMANDVNSQIGNIHLITADGSVDCFKSPECQEEMVYELQFAEICTALRILSNHGNFLLKTFTLFQATTVSMIYLLNCIFNQVSITKPGTSKSGNSEVYIVCLDYQKNTKNLNKFVEILLTKVGKNKTTPIFAKSSLPTDFLNQIEFAASYFMTNQIDAIELNIWYFTNPSSQEDKRCISARNLFCVEYFNRFNIRAIKKVQNIVFNKSYEKNSNKKCKNISINYASDDNRRSFENYLETWSIHHNWLIDTKPKEFKSSSNIVNLKIYKGKSITDLNNSRFVDLKLILLRNKIGSLTNANTSMYNQSAKAYLKCSNNSNDLNIEFLVPNKDPTYGDAERNFFKKLINFILIYEPLTINFENYIFLTHFAVSVLTFLMNNVYEKLEFNINNNLIILSIRKPNGGCEIEKLNNCLNSQNLQEILCFVNIKNLHYNQFIDVLCVFNNNLLCKDCRKLL